MSQHGTRLVLGVVLLLGLAPSTHGAAPGADGIWTLRERVCAAVNSQRHCGPGREQFMFYQGRAFYRGFGSEDAWSEIGTVSVDRGKLRVQVTREGIGRLVENLIGFDVSDLLQNFSFVYSGTLRPGRITDGHALARLEIDVEDQLYRIRVSGTFTGRRVGDASEPAPPDLEDFSDFSAPRGEAMIGHSESSARGILSAIAAVLRDADEQ